MSAFVAEMGELIAISVALTALLGPVIWLALGLTMGRRRDGR
mgnify:CR=1 FL=1